MIDPTETTQRTVEAARAGDSDALDWLRIVAPDLAEEIAGDDAEIERILAESASYDAELEPRLAEWDVENADILAQFNKYEAMAVSEAHHE